MTATFTAVFEQDGDWWVDYVEELPGANTQGATLEEARENLQGSRRAHSRSKPRAGAA
jgi:predicted RNase H-like HicB family nuclease